MCVGGGDWLLNFVFLILLLRVIRKKLLSSSNLRFKLRLSVHRNKFNNLNHFFAGFGTKLFALVSICVFSRVELACKMQFSVLFLMQHCPSTIEQPWQVCMIFDIVKVYCRHHNRWCSQCLQLVKFNQSETRMHLSRNI